MYLLMMIMSTVSLLCNLTTDAKMHVHVTSTDHVVCVFPLPLSRWKCAIYMGLVIHMQRNQNCRTKKSRGPACLFAVIFWHVTVGGRFVDDGGGGNGRTDARGLKTTTAVRPPIGGGDGGRGRTSCLVAGGWVKALFTCYICRGKG